MGDKRVYLKGTLPSAYATPYRRAPSHSRISATSSPPPPPSLSSVPTAGEPQRRQEPVFPPPPRRAQLLQRRKMQRRENLALFLLVLLLLAFLTHGARPEPTEHTATRAPSLVSAFAPRRRSRMPVNLPFSAMEGRIFCCPCNWHLIDLCMWPRRIQRRDLRWPSRPAGTSA